MKSSQETKINKVGVVEICYPTCQNCKTTIQLLNHIGDLVGVTNSLEDLYLEVRDYFYSLKLLGLKDSEKGDYPSQIKDRGYLAISGILICKDCKKHNLLSVFRHPEKLCTSSEIDHTFSIDGSLKNYKYDLKIGWWNNTLENNLYITNVKQALEQAN